MDKTLILILTLNITIVFSAFSQESSDTTVMQMSEYFKNILTEKGYSKHQVVEDSLKKWELMNDKVYWTKNEKDLHDVPMYNKKKHPLYNNTVLLMILKGFSHKVRKEIREQKQNRYTYEEVLKIVKLSVEGISKISETHKGDPTKPTVILVGQIQNFKIGNPIMGVSYGKGTNYAKVVKSQNRIYLFQENLYKKGIRNFGYAGLGLQEFSKNLSSTLWINALFSYENKKEIEFMTNYPNGFYFGLEIDSIKNAALKSYDNYLLMLEIDKYPSFKKDKFSMSKKDFLKEIKNYFFSEIQYKPSFLKKTELFLYNKDTLYYEDYRALYFSFRDEWQEKVHNLRNIEASKITKTKAENTGKLSGYVVLNKEGKNHFQIPTDFNNLTPEEADKACYTLQVVYKDMGWSYIYISF